MPAGSFLSSDPIQAFLLKSVDTSTKLIVSVTPGAKRMSQSLQKNVNFFKIQNTNYIMEPCRNAGLFISMVLMNEDLQKSSLPTYLRTVRQSMFKIFAISDGFFF